MLYIETASKDAAFHFAAEEYLTRLFSETDEPVAMLWQTDKCVMLGSNQVASAEIDEGYATRNGMQIVRRLSGGGTIFTDSGTLLYTMTLPFKECEGAREIAETVVAAPVIEALNMLGVPARLEGRNDILVNEKKVSGIAQYVKGGRLCSHCSLLYDADLEALSGVLTVDGEKISSKALRSVRSRVTNIKEYMERPYTTLEFRELLKQKLFAERGAVEYKLTARNLEEIGNIREKTFGNPAWTYGRSPKYSFHNSKRFRGGKVEIFINAVNGNVEECSIRGDFLGIKPIAELEQMMENNLFRREEIALLLSGVDLSQYLGGITKEQMLACMFE